MMEPKNRVKGCGRDLAHVATSSDVVVVSAVQTFEGTAHSLSVKRVGHGSRQAGCRKIYVAVIGAILNEVETETDSVFADIVDFGVERCDGISDVTLELPVSPSS